MRPIVLLTCLILLATASPLAAQGQMTRERAEELGIDLEPPAAAADKAETPKPRRPKRGPRGGLPDFLLIPESTNDRVMSFDPATGDLINADFIPADATNLSTPIHAILSASGDSILVSDQLEDVVQEYDMAGNFLGTFAPAGGADTAILDNVRGISLRPNGNLLVTVGGGANDDAVAEFDTTGASVGNFVANGAGGLDSPFDVLLAGDALVGGINSDAVHRYDASTGAYIADLAAINSFPEQIALAGNGNILVANFTGTQEGVVELMPDGTLVGVYNPPEVDGYRGVYELPNGNLLVTDGGGVHEITRAGTFVESKITGVSGRFIELIQDAVPVELQSFSVD